MVILNPSNAVVDKFLLDADLIHVVAPKHLPSLNIGYGSIDIQGSITIAHHFKGKAEEVNTEYIPIVLHRLSVLEAQGKFICIRASTTDTVLERRL